MQLNLSAVSGLATGGLVVLLANDRLPEAAVLTHLPSASA
jgi:hypothetical protein